MKSLEDFLALPDVDNIEEEVFVSKRLGKFRVKAMNEDDYAEYTRRAKSKIRKDGVEFDTAKFHILICAGQTLAPDFADAKILEKAGCATASDLIKKKLLPGEITELANKICEISGFDTDINDEIEEAKN